MDSFDKSPLDAFIKSPLDARNSPGGILITYSGFPTDGLQAGAEAIADQVRPVYASIGQSVDPQGVFNGSLASYRLVIHALGIRSDPVTGAISQIAPEPWFSQLPTYSGRIIWLTDSYAVGPVQNPPPDTSGKLSLNSINSLTGMTVGGVTSSVFYSTRSHPLTAGCFALLGESLAALLTGGNPLTQSSVVHENTAGQTSFVIHGGSFLLNRRLTSASGELRASAEQFLRNLWTVPIGG